MHAAKRVVLFLLFILLSNGETKCAVNMKIKRQQQRRTTVFHLYLLQSWPMIKYKIIFNWMFIQNRAAHGSVCQVVYIDWICNQNYKRWIKYKRKRIVYSQSHSLAFRLLFDLLFFPFLSSCLTMSLERLMTRKERDNEDQDEKEEEEGRFSFMDQNCMYSIYSIF